ncbi:hypothetical protein [Nocardia sp. NPDC058633]|uniref:hypothetical protein n=1 Tax=Nocardia sp. NPDC058633 TaxID=3346568 RepID=UPI00364CEC38
MDEWNGLISRLFYGIQFESDLSDDLAARIAGALIAEPIETLTVDEEYSILTNGIQHNFPLPTIVEMKQGSAELYEFVQRIVAQMDAMRPWAEPEYLQLSSDWLSVFESSQPIARITIPVPGLEGRLARGFNRSSEDGPFLLLRLRSGAIVGFFSPVWAGSNDVMLVGAGIDYKPESILRELIDTGRIEADRILPLTESDHQHTQPSTQYETTPIQPPFYGENLPGNNHWGGKQVKYLTEDERREFLLSVHGGLLYDSRGNLFDTSSAHTLWTPAGGRAIFAMDQLGNLYSAPFHILGEFHHSSFLAGEPVAGAGEIAASQGRVLLISDHSTHYRPARRYTRQVTENLRRLGVDVADHQIEYHAAE